MSEPERDPMPTDAAVPTLEAYDVDVVEVDVVEVDVLEVDVVSVEVVEVDGGDLVEAVEESVDEAAPVFEPTGEPRVDDAAARLHDIDAAPTSEHVAIFEDVHGRLQEALRDLGSAD